MPTGLLIRDFVKVYRELRFTSSGSFEFSEIEHNAYLNRVTVEIDAIDSQRYYNAKTLPSHSHYGYVTTFKGSSVLAKIPVEFARQRVFECINQGIWNYHQSTESLQLGSDVTVSSTNESSNNIVDRLGDGIGDILCFAVLLYDDTPVDGGMGWITDVLGCDSEEVEGNAVSEKYRAFPIASPYPDIFKFKSDIPVSFRFRIESWYLVNPTIYVADNPTDTSDETEGEDEYPSPTVGDGDGDGSEFPSPDPLPGGRDPRDGTGGILDPSGTYTYRITVSGDHLNNLGEIGPYTDTVDLELVPNGLPLTADAGDDFYGTVSGQALYYGISIRDKFGSEEYLLSPGTAFVRGGHSITTSLLPTGG